MNKAKPFLVGIGSFFLLLCGFRNDPSNYGVNQSQNWLSPSWADTIVAPNLVNSPFIQAGKALYLGHCIVCHGANGKGDGESGFGLEVPPGDFTDAFTLNESNGALFWKIATGRGPMPAFLTKLSDNQKWQVVAYLRELQRKHKAKSGNSKNRKK